MKTKRLLAIFALLCITIVHTHAQVVFNATNFPDANFRQWLKDKYSRYGFTTEGVTISAEQLGSLKELSLYNSGTSNLKGIEHFKNLETLSYSANGYSGVYEEYVSSEIDLSKNTALKSLRLGSIKNVTSLNLSKLTALLQLSLDHLEDLTSLNINNCTNLHLVELAALWALPTLNISNLSNLYFIDLQVLNHLTSLTLPNQSNLFGLKMQNMDALENIDLSKQTKLQIFNDNVSLTSRLKLSSIDFSKNTELRSIYITDYLRGGSILTSINISNLKKLSVLTLRYTSISSLDLSSNSNLKVVDVRNNTLRNIDMSKQTKLGTEDDFVHYSESGRPIIENGFDPFQYTQSLGIPYWGIGAGGLMDLSGAILDVSGQKCKDELLIQSNTKVAVSYPTTLNPSYVSNMKLDGTAVSFSNASGYHTMTRTFAQINDMLWGNNGTNKPTFTYDYDVKCGTAAYANTKMDVTVETMPFVAVGDNNGGSGNFPDANFRTIAKTFDTHARTYKDVFAGTATRDDRLDYDELKAITKVNAANKSIAKINGIEYMKFLQTLDCQGNTLTALPVTYNTELTAIEARNNQIASVDLSKNTKLKTLHLGWNNLSSINVTANTELTSFYCCYNSLTAINVSKNTKLQTLGCYQNEIAGTLNLSSHTALVNLYCDNNKFTKLTLPATATLQNVNCYYNELTGGLDASKNTGLVTLNCYGNLNLGTLKLPTTKTLKRLWNFNCGLSGSLDMSYYTNLEDLACRNNQYTELKLPNTTTLWRLHTNNNKLTTLDVTKNTGLTELWCHYNHLKVLDLSKQATLTQLNVANQTSFDDLLILSNTKAGIPRDAKGVAANYVNMKLDGTAKTMTSETIDGVNYQVMNGLNYTQVIGLLNGEHTTKYDYNTKCATSAFANKLMDVTLATRPFVAICSGNFLDAKFLTAVKAYDKYNDGYDEEGYYQLMGQDNKLSKEELEAVTSINVNNHGISKMNGVEYFYKLVTLNCGQNNLAASSSLPLTYNTELKTLYCNDNQLPAIDVSKNTKLQYLQCANNQIAGTLNLTNNSNMRTLYCHQNQISALTVSNTASLETVNCATNKIVSLDLSKHNTLKSLVCNGQEDKALKTLSLSASPTALTYLNANYNSLSSIANLDKATALETCYLIENLFTELDLTKNTNLKDVRVQTQGNYREFTALHTLKLPSTTTLTRLEIWNNNLAAIDLSKTTNLSDLKLTPQWISEDFLVTTPNKVEALGSTPNLNGRVDSRMSNYVMQSKTLNSFANILAALKSIVENGDGAGTGSYKYDTKCASTVRPTIKDTLMTVTVKGYPYVAVNNTGNFTKGTGAGNFSTDTKFTEALKASIKNVANDRLTPHQIAGVKNLSIQNKDINIADGFGWFWNLEKLYCNNNNLSSIDVTMNGELLILHCQNCQLNSIDVTKNTKLERLNTDNNHLTELDVTKNTALNYLHCKTNEITALNVTKNTNLATLDCSQNQIQTLDMTKNTKLEWMACGFNQLKKLDVTKAPLLYNLTCGYNQISELDMTKNPLMKNLSCPHNLISELDVTNMNALENLACHNNKIAALDLSQNAVLDSLNCSKNQIAALDLNNNTALTRLHCQENHLRTLDLSQHENLIRLNCNDQTSEEDITVFEFDKIGIYLPTGGKKENFLNMVVAGQNRAADIYSNGEQYLVVNPTPTADIDMYDKSVTYRYNTECATPEFANHVMENVVITTWPYVMYVNPNSQSIAGNFYSGTIVLDYDAVVPAGTETYIVKGLKATPRQMLYNGTMYSLQQLDMQRIATAGEVIPANTPVYVKSNTQTGLHAFSRNLTDATPVAVPSGNLLKGSPTSDITVEPYSILTLGREKTTREVGFWQYSGTKSAAHRCYLDASVLNGAVISTTSGSSKGAIFCFDDEDFGETTGIDAGLNGNEQNDTWHTLSGIRLNGKPTKSGIYIHNGRKEVIK